MRTKLGLWSTDTLGIAFDLFMSLLVTCIKKINLCYFFCVDLEKAIDSVDTIFLRAFSFGPDT